MAMRQAAFAVVVSEGLAAGCGGSGGATSTPTQVSLGALPDLIAQTTCDQNFKCSSTADIMGRLKTDCISTNTQAWQFVAGSVQSGEGDGRLTYDATLMGTCISKLAAETCADWVTGLDQPAECHAAFEGKVALAGACQSDFECAAGHCDGVDDSTTPPTDGACVAYIAHGAACTANDTCVTTDYCDDTSMTCTSKKTGGAACMSDDECGYSCNTTTSQCSGYGGCSIAPVTPRGTLLSVLAVGLALSAARRRKR
jgi:hypothetical protein